ncbi:MAG: AI-2E family transporter [Armatimonadota bacterium]|nr:MAG: AI-2E family transporter [Armatimonadota bacterium]
MDRRRQPWLRAVAAALLLLAAGLLVWRVRHVIVIILVAVVCAYVLRPLVYSLIRPCFRMGSRSFRLSRGIATGIVFVLLVLALWGIWALSAPSLNRQVRELQVSWPRYRDALVRVYTQAAEIHRDQLPAGLRPVVDSWVGGAADLVTSTASKGLRMTFHGVGFVIEILLLPILTFYFLADGPGIRRQALFFVPRRYLRRTEYALDRVDDILQRYIKGQIILCLIAFVVVTAGLRVLGIKFYLLLGLIAGLTRAVPIIGPVVGAIPIIIVVGVTESFVYALWLLIPITALHVVESKVLMPAILGQQLDLHPALIIVGLLIGAEMGGLLGVFLAAPVLAAVKVLVGRRRAGAAQAAQ